MNSSYRAAVIGLGRMGSTFDDEMTRGGSIYLPYCHTPAYVASPHTVLVGGADLNDEQRSIYAERWDMEGHVYSDYRELLEKEKPDIVSVCTTARVRADIVEDLACYGVKAIWAEKPIALTLAEADRMVSICAEHNVTVAVNCARRWNPHYTSARELIEAGVRFMHDFLVDDPQEQSDTLLENIWNAKKLNYLIRFLFHKSLQQHEFAPSTQSKVSRKDWPHNQVCSFAFLVLLR